MKPVSMLRSAIWAYALTMQHVKIQLAVSSANVTMDTSAMGTTDVKMWMSALRLMLARKLTAKWVRVLEHVTTYRGESF